MLKLKAISHYSPGKLEFMDCNVSFVVEVPYAEFDELTKHPLKESRLLEEYDDHMYVSDGDSYGLLVLGAGYNDGIWVGVKKPDGAKFSTYVSTAREQIEQELENLADDCMRITPDDDQTISVYLEDVESFTGTTVTDDCYLARAFFKILGEHGTVSHVEGFDDVIVVTPREPEPREENAQKTETPHFDGMHIKIPLERKPSDFYLQDCLIDKVITLPQAEFDDLVEHPMASRDCIAQNVEVMFQDEKGHHCLLALGAGSSDGLLIEAEGYDYARYAAYLPGAHTIVENAVNHAIDFIVAQGLENSSEGLWAVHLEDLEEELGIKATPDNGIGEMILDGLADRKEVFGASLTDECFETTLFTDYCFNLDSDLKKRPMQGQQM